MARANDNTAFRRIAGIARHSEAIARSEGRRAGYDAGYSDGYERGYTAAVQHIKNIIAESEKLRTEDIFAAMGLKTDADYLKAQAKATGKKYCAHCLEICEHATEECACSGCDRCASEEDAR